jgi:hypothetical protein
MPHFKVRFVGGRLRCDPFDRAANDWSAAVFGHAKRRARKTSIFRG